MRSWMLAVMVILESYTFWGNIMDTKYRTILSRWIMEVIKMHCQTEGENIEFPTFTDNSFYGLLLMLHYFPVFSFSILAKFATSNFLFRIEIFVYILCFSLWVKFLQTIISMFQIKSNFILHKQMFGQWPLCSLIYNIECQSVTNRCSIVAFNTFRNWFYFCSVTWILWLKSCILNGTNKIFEWTKCVENLRSFTIRKIL